MAIITLTTDFGTADGYVGAMKGVIARLTDGHRSVAVVDLAHDIPPGDIAHAAWVVASSTTEFPRGTIHVVVVDPGVGGTRRDVVLAARGQFYVGPDNGVFAYVAEHCREAYAIENERFRAEHVSRTFHGRDVFAPTAAAIASGEQLSSSGPAVRLAGKLPWGPRKPNVGRIVHIDRFGNLVSDLPEAEAGKAITIGGFTQPIGGVTLPIVGTYEDVERDQLLAYIGSARTVEIAVRDGSAVKRLGTPRGTLVAPVPIGAVPGGPYR